MSQGLQASFDFLIVLEFLFTFPLFEVSINTSTNIPEVEISSELAVLDCELDCVLELLLVVVLDLFETEVHHFLTALNL